MKESYLEVTYRHGKTLAAFYYPPRGARDKAYRTWQPAPGLVVDYTRAGKPIGIEITAPHRRRGRTGGGGVGAFVALHCVSSAMSRQRRLVAPGILRHVMVRGLDRQRIFRDDADRADFVVRAERFLSRDPLVGQPSR